MSKIKEQLIGYEQNDWIADEDHVRVDEVTEYLLYAMSVVRDAAGRTTAHTARPVHNGT